MLQVQHHYAHILSCMTENDCQEPVIGVSFDGTGYGTDGTIWGGEILLADYQDFTRFGSITPFLQIGGDASAKEGWRIAVSMIYGYTKDRAKHGRSLKTGALQRTGKQGAVYNGGTKDQCSNVNQRRTGF